MRCGKVKASATVGCRHDQSSPLTWCRVPSCIAQRYIYTYIATKHIRTLIFSSTYHACFLLRLDGDGCLAQEMVAKLSDKMTPDGLTDLTNHVTMFRDEKREAAERITEAKNNKANVIANQRANKKKTAKKKKASSRSTRRALCVDGFSRRKRTYREGKRRSCQWTGDVSIELLRRGRGCRKGGGTVHLSWEFHGR